MTMTGALIDADTRDISDEVLEAPGRPRVMPADFYRRTTPEERLLLCAQNGFYLLPTVELVEWLRARIGGRKAIEIGAGNGALAAALGIHATDSKMQERADIVRHYERLAHPPVKYGPLVEELDAAEATRRYRPDVVVAAWVTHKWRPDRHSAAGNMYGVNEENVLRKCHAYIFIGNERVHEGKSIWKLPHEIHYPDWLFSRAANGSRDFIAVWPGSKP